MNSFSLSPIEIGVAALIFAAGFVLAWFWSRARAVEQSASRIRELEAGAGGHQSVESELRRQTADLRVECDGLREKLNEEQQRRTVAETTASKVRENLDEQRKLLDDARSKFSEAFQGLASEALAKPRSNFWNSPIRNSNHCAAIRSAIWNCVKWRSKGLSRRWNRLSRN
jgi:hypothetical protein